LTAKDTVKRALFDSNDIVCAYLTGSIIREDPLIGGTTDIDLVYVHSIDTSAKRELIPIAEDYHLDISHFSQSFFSQPRKLRTDAWIGSFLCHYPIVLHETNHWFDYVRSAVFANFFQPVNIIERVSPFIEEARRDWVTLQNQGNDLEQDFIHIYLKSIKNAANAIACLTSVPLTERRMLIDFPAAAIEIQMPGLTGGLIDLLVPPDPIEPDWETWLNNWNIAFSSIQQINNIPLSYSEIRRPYYEKAILGLKDENNQAALWLLLWTWSLISSRLPKNGSSQKGYMDLLGQLMLDSDHFLERLAGLDQFLDAVEETIDNWKISAGL
ncbi:hypothetical protein MUP35_00270, partial [Patescibacteria group bacterium]|nr:hypothetical protein [Patescibacteria group bacterium]